MWRSGALGSGNDVEVLFTVCEHSKTLSSSKFSYDLHHRKVLGKRKSELFED